jgi:hypothetical protein
VSTAACDTPGASASGGASAGAAGAFAAAPRRPQAPAAALCGLVLLALAGAWLVAAPFVLGDHGGAGDQRRGAAWTASTRVDVSAGAALVAVAIAALLGYLACAITWLARYRRTE